MMAPSLICMCGVPGSGKTTIANKLKQDLGMIVLNPAKFRTTHVPLSISESPIVDAEWYGAAEEFLKSGKSVVMDSTFHRRIKREKLYLFNEGLRHDLMFIHCVCDSRTAMKRLKYQQEIGQKTFYCDISDMVLAYSKTYEDILEDPQKPPIIRFNSETGAISKFNYDGSELFNRITAILSK